MKVSEDTDKTINALLTMKAKKVLAGEKDLNVNRNYHDIYKQLIAQIRRGEITEEEAIDSAVVVYMVGYKKFCDMCESGN